MNFVWNWCNEAQKLATRHNNKWPSGFDLNKLSSGCSSEVGLHRQTIQEICEKYVDSRNTGERSCLRFGGKKSRGWVLFKASGLRIRDGLIIYGKRKVQFCSRRSIPAEARVLTGSFAENGSGQWLLNVTVEPTDTKCLPAEKEIGIGLGLNELAACSDGTKIDRSGFYRKLELRLAVAQRAGK